MDVDICIIGGGICGVGVACYIKRNFPHKKLVLIEKRDDIGGTWDLFRYPGIRTDSDMYTYGYDFKSFSGNKIFREGPEIKDYIKSAASESGLAEVIMLGQSVQSVEWQSGLAQWTINSINTKSSSEIQFRSHYVVFCTGYYAYDSGYTPDFPNIDDFEGRVLHPQAWPKAFDYKGKDVVIIGSGATAVTLAPAMSKDARQVTVLQRSPTYVVPMTSTSPTATIVYSIFPSFIAYKIVRAMFVIYQIVTTTLLSSWPSLAKSVVLLKTSKALGESSAHEMAHFQPSYNPWEQRLCMCPDGDLFETIKQRKVTYLTDQVRTFTTDGILLTSGSSIKADVVVTATGFNLQALGGIRIVVDGEVKSVRDCVTYKGVMLCGVPNMFWCMGYNGASLTLKVEPVAVYITRMLRFLDINSLKSVEPVPPGVRDQSTKRIFTSSSTYVKRNGHVFPLQGARSPWRYIQNYLADMWPLKLQPIRRNDETLKFT